jgi:hypothetical protein
LADVPQLIVAFNFEEEVFEIAEGVGVAISKVHLIFIMWKGIVP